MSAAEREEDARTTPAVAVVGMACRYPDARNPQELWENALAQRRAFRRLPSERLSLADYLSAPAGDGVYVTEAAVVEGYEFDRVAFRVAGSTFRSVDLTHWLALDVADQALRDAGLPEGEGLPRETTGVLVGNSLTGEFSRASVMRLRWPYVRRVVAERLRHEGFDSSRRQAFLGELETSYKAPFAPVDEETLAGGLSNTIAGRICNYFHLGGGGYTLDGACCSSLLAVARACSALEDGELDVALAGGVDLSLDPFELVGFSRVGALARGAMRVYDQGSSGFLPGEGCGFVVLMRLADARARGHRVYAVIRGWGISSDGGGGITRPEVKGQTLALERAYRRAGYGPETVTYFEGHGTGTPVGDEVELQALAETRRASGATRPALLGSIKANIGHTKAAAGAAGLIKAVMSLGAQVLPPMTSLRRPRSEADGDGAMLRLSLTGEPWPAGEPLRAGVSSFGFGGINVHVSLEGAARARRTALSRREETLLSSVQDCELFLLSADKESELLAQVERLADLAPRLSYAELADVAAALCARLRPGRARAAVVASAPGELAQRLGHLAARLRAGQATFVEPEAGIYAGVLKAPPRVVFLFPGQASPVRTSAGPMGRRFGVVRESYAALSLPQTEDPLSTELAQPAIVAAELAGLRWLESLGLEAGAAVGHSLGELAALHWAGAADAATAMELATVRGRLMAHVGGPKGAMLSLAAAEAEVRALLNGTGNVALACFNSPSQTVVSGEQAALREIAARARAHGIGAAELPTSHAFHSPLMLPAEAPFGTTLQGCDLRALERRVISTVTGAALQPAADLRELLRAQLTSPVRFADALAAAGVDAELCIEVGPGQILTRLAREAGLPAVALDVAGPSLAGLLGAAAAAHALGAPFRPQALFEDRFTRPFDLERPLRFFVNPCELAPRSEEPAERQAVPQVAAAGQAQARAVAPAPPPRVAETAEAGDPVDVVRALVAERAELPLASVQEGTRLLRDLHLNSIAVGELVATAARRLGLTPPSSPLDFADASVGEVGHALARLRDSGAAALPEPDAAPPGVADWARAFTLERRPRALARPARAEPGSGPWRVLGTCDAALVARLARSTPSWPGSGTVVVLPSAPSGPEADLLLDAARGLLDSSRRDRRLVVVQPRASAAAFARTLHIEEPEITTCVVEAPFDEHVVARVEDEARAARGHVEAVYDSQGTRHEPCLRLLPLSADGDVPVPVGAGELLLVTGGGKGIVLECARALARATGAFLALLGRARPEEDAELQANLAQLAAEGLAFRYVPADVTDAGAVRAAVAALQAERGPVAGVLHGAGVNKPALLRALEPAALARTLAPKAAGLRNVLAALDAARLELLVAFGSIIGRAGLRGEADYALANGTLRELTEQFQAGHPHCRCLVLESSVWSGVGMGERLGRIEALRREGITPIAPAEGTSLLLRLLRRRAAPTSVLVMGRLGAEAPYPHVAPALPLLRFLERPRVFYPGVELVVDAELSTASDPYLLDHVFDGQVLFLAVMGLEAMAQAASALTGATGLPVFEDVRFDRPVAVAAREPVTLRVAALAHEDGLVEIALRTSQTAFQVDHFRCRLRFANAQPSPPPFEAPPARLALRPEVDLYGGLLFHTGRFRRVQAYRHLRASGSVAEVAADPGRPWFSTYLPPTLLLGDAAARDAALHSIQACVPHGVLLPVGVERLTAGSLDPGEPLMAVARERWRESETYCYDLELYGAGGALRERWEGLRLRRVTPVRTEAWCLPLLTPYLEWRLRELVPGSLARVALEPSAGGNGHGAGTDEVIRRALGGGRALRRRADGKPEADGGLQVSASHTDGLTLALADAGPAGCDVESVAARSPEAWRDLLGPGHWRLAELVAGQAGEPSDVSATRAWSALESLKKAGAGGAPLRLRSCEPDGWVVFEAAGLSVATCAVRVRERAAPLVVAAALSGQSRSGACASSSTGTPSASRTPTS